MNNKHDYKLEFHPCSTPEGMLQYNVDDLTNEQQKELNTFKINKIRENHKYLAKHPEIRAIISLLLDELLKERPKANVRKLINKFFQRSPYDLQEQINHYLEKNNLIVVDEDEAEIQLDETMSDEECRIGEFCTSTKLCADIVELIFNAATQEQEEIVVDDAAKSNDLNVDSYTGFNETDALSYMDTQFQLGSDDIFSYLKLQQLFGPTHDGDQ